MKNDGSEAQTAFLGRMASAGAIVERFWDQSDLRGLNKGRAVGDFAKPSDFLVTLSGVMHYAEVKSTQNDHRFPFGNIEDGQRSCALRHAAARAGSCYRFYIFSYSLGEWFVMDANDFADAISAGQKSISFTDLLPWSI